MKMSDFPELVYTKKMPAEISADILSFLLMYYDAYDLMLHLCTYRNLFNRVVAIRLLTAFYGFYADVVFVIVQHSFHRVALVEFAFNNQF